MPRLRALSISLFAALAVIVAVPAVQAGFSGTDVYIASTGRGPGAASSEWSTTIWIYNPGASPANVQFSFLKRDQTNAATPYVFNDTVPAGDTKRYDNAVETMFGLTNAFGAIRAVCATPVIVNSRIFSTPPGGEDRDSAGQFFAAVPAAFALAFNQSTQLLGVYQTTPAASSQFRYNFGFVETTGTGATVQVGVFDSTGASLATKNYTLGAYEVRQYGFNTEFPSISTTNARIQVSVIAGTGKVIAFGSGLANQSNDPSTFEMSFSEALLSGGLTSVTHDATLIGDGTPISALGLKVPMDISSSGVGTSTLKSTYSGGEGSAVYGVCTNGCVGVEGRHTPSGNYAYIGWQSGGIYAEGLTTMGVRGNSNTGYGVWGSSQSNYGVLGTSGSGVGVAGAYQGTSGTNPGVSGTTASTSSNAVGVYGLVSSTSPGDSSAAVRGENKGTGGLGIGVWGSQAGSGWGVYGTAVTGLGVYGASGSAGNGVYAYASGSARNNAALRANNTNTSGGMAAYLTNHSNYATAHFANAGAGEVLYLQNNGGLFIKAVNNAENNTLFSVDGNGNVRADGTFASPAADFAEMLPAQSGLEAGDLVAIGSDGALERATTPYQTNVAGIYSTRPAFLGGERGSVSETKIPLAIVGIVPVKASAENGAIRPGDMLVASATPGHVMRCEARERCVGGIVGKALTPLDRATGTITALVSLH